jgi:hypothetical protein
MKKIRPSIWSYSVFVLFLIMAIASATSHPTYSKPKPQPCITHKGLTYAPVLVKFNITGSYTMKDLSGAQISGSKYLIDEMNSLAYSKYQIADGVTPNLNLYVTINTDNYQHYGAYIQGYVYDGDFSVTLNTDYYTAEKLFDDIAKKVNVFIQYGWCRNCPGPCNP